MNRRLDNARIIRAPRGTELQRQELADRSAAAHAHEQSRSGRRRERPGELVVYGGIGRAARDWESFDRIVAALRALEGDETLLVQSGKPVGVFRTHADAPRVLIANSNLVPHWATLGAFQRARSQGPDDVRPDDGGLAGSTSARRASCRAPTRPSSRWAAGTTAATSPGNWILTAGLGGMGGAQPLAATMAGASLPRGRMPAERASRCGCAPAISTPGQGPRRGAGASSSEAGGTQKPVSVGAARQCRRDLAGARAARRAARRRHRPDLGARSDQRLPAEGLDARRMAKRSARRDPQGRRARPRRPRWPSTSARCSTSTRMGVPTRRLRQQHPPDGAGRRASTNAFDFPGFVPAYIRPLFCRGIGPFRWAALSGDPEDIYQDRRQGEGADARQHAPAQLARHGARAHQLPGPAGAHLLGRASATATGSASPSTRWWRSGELKAPIVIGRDHLDSRLGRVSPNRETEAMKDGSDAVSDWPLLNALLNCASGATWVSLHHGGGVGMGYLAARRHGHRLRRHAGSGEAHRARAVERSRHRRHAPCRCGLRDRDRLRARARGWICRAWRHSQAQSRASNFGIVVFAPSMKVWTASRTIASRSAGIGVA